MRSPTIANASRLMLLTVIFSAALCCSEERKQFFNAELSPHTSQDGIILRLISFDQTTSHLRATIMIENGSLKTLELPAKDLMVTWIKVVIGDKSYDATVSYPILDPDQHWPNERPLRRTVDLESSLRATYYIDCAYSPKLTDADACPAITVNGLLGNDKAPFEIKIALPESSHAIAKPTP
jgi:hypothetical protein